MLTVTFALALPTVPWHWVGLGFALGMIIGHVRGREPICPTGPPDYDLDQRGWS
jgi:hypothetical protein